jgi:hypothetical protein
MIRNKEIMKNHFVLPTQTNRWLARLALAGLSVLLLSLGLMTARPEQALAAEAESGAPTALCLPGVYSETPDDCLPLGPSVTLSEMSAQGFELPLRPMPSAQTDPGLKKMPFYYLELKSTGPTAVYNTSADALAKTSPARVISGGELRYVSFTDIYYGEGGVPVLYWLRETGWINAEDVENRVWESNNFQGITLRQTPDRPFGWVLPLDYSFKLKRTPGYATTGFSSRTLLPYDVVQVYSTRVVDNYPWYQVGPNEWIEARFVGLVTPNDTPPAGVTGSRWIEINLEEQTLAVYEGGRMVFATLIATGQDPFFTQPGVFQIYKKLDATHMSGAFTADRSDYYYLQDVPWTMYYDKARALHTAYWRTRFGYPQSHGCVNLAPGDAHWLFVWAQEGDWVYVHDPSGKTPTDPKLYGDGGA